MVRDEHALRDQLSYQHRALPFDTGDDNPDGAHDGDTAPTGDTP